MLPNMTVVAMADERAVSDTTLAAVLALQRAPNENAPEVMKNILST
jgi:hypothetical protein